MTHHNDQCFNSFLFQISKPTAAMLAVALSLSLIGCAGTGRKIDSSEYSALAEGKTTRAEVIRNFGEPNGSTFIGNQESLTYQFSESDNRQFIPIVGPILIMATGSKTTVQYCSFGFDTKGILLSKLCGGLNNQGSGMLTGVLPK